jgi:hypothetical protein
MKNRNWPWMISRLAALIALVALVLLALGLVGTGPLMPLFYKSIPVAANGGVTEIDLAPVPEGPPLSFRRTPTTAGGVRPLGPFERFIPEPLPAPMFQWGCNRGRDMVITLANGKEVTYGPCYRPASINQLWSELVPPGPAN